MVTKYFQMYDANGEGAIDKGSDISFADARNAAVGSFLDDDYAGKNHILARIEGGNTGSSPRFIISRYFCNPDCRNLPNNAEISSVSIMVFVHGKREDFDSSIHIVSGSQASTTDLVVEDYNNLTFSSLGSINITDLVVNQYNLIPFDSVTSITKQSINKFVLIDDIDLTNTEPATRAIVDIHTKDNTNPPLLKVVYKSPISVISFI